MDRAACVISSVGAVTDKHPDRGALSAAATTAAADFPRKYPQSSSASVLAGYLEVNTNLVFDFTLGTRTRNNLVVTFGYTHSSAAAHTMSGGLPPEALVEADNDPFAEDSDADDDEAAADL
jgi:hypothetical protein